MWIHRHVLLGINKISVSIIPEYSCIITASAYLLILNRVLLLCSYISNHGSILEPLKTPRMRMAAGYVHSFV
jgi:hypothetical protein